MIQYPRASTSCTPENKTPNSDPALLLQDSMYPTNRLSFIRHLVHLPDIFSQSDISDDATKTSIVFNLLIFRILNTNRQVSVFPETCLRHPFSASVLIRQLVFSTDHSSRTIHPHVRLVILPSTFSSPYSPSAFLILTSPFLVFFIPPFSPSSSPLLLLGHPPTYPDPR